MQQNRKALGKGLSALISDSKTFTKNLEGQSGYPDYVKQLSLNDVHPNPNQPRKSFDKEEIANLVESIKQHGVLQPILVRELEDNTYQIIAGERRWQASKRANLQTIPAIIKNTDETETFELSIIENIQRQNLEPLEEAQAYSKLLNELGCTQEELAKKLGKSRSYITNAMRLLKLPEDIQELLKERKITSGHAKILVGSSFPSELAKVAVDNNASVRQLEQMTREMSPGTRRVPKISRDIMINVPDVVQEKEHDIIELEKRLSEKLGILIQINARNESGEFHFEIQGYE